MNLPWFFPTLFSSLEIERQLIRIWLISENCGQNDIWKYCDPNTWELTGLFDGPLQGRIDPETLLGGMLLAHTDTKSVSKLKKVGVSGLSKKGWIVNGVRVGGPQHPAPDSVSGLSCMYGNFCTHLSPST